MNLRSVTPIIRRSSFEGFSDLVGVFRFLNKKWARNGLCCARFAVRRGMEAALGKRIENPAAADAENEADEPRTRRFVPRSEVGFEEVDSQTAQIDERDSKRGRDECSETWTWCE